MNDQEEIYAYQKALRSLEDENSKLSSSVSKGTISDTSSMISDPSYQNLIQWQLDIEQELELVERLLRGHKTKRKENGDIIWVEPTDEEDKLLNDRGVQEIMKLIRLYVNKNTLLSNYDAETINVRVKQFSERLSRFIYMNYEDFGMDTPYKQRHYEMIVLNITDMVESAYLRAFNGGERDSLRTARTVTQTDNGQGNSLFNNSGMSPIRDNKKWYNPLSW